MPNSAHLQFSPLQPKEHLQSRPVSLDQNLDFSTFGLHGGWKPAWVWATAQGLQTNLLQVIDTTLTREKFNAFGSILRFLSSEHSYHLLESWRHIDDAPGLLWRLAQATIRAPEILKHYPRLPVETSAANQLQGETRSHYLLGTLLERLPAASPDANSWIQTLRLWLLAHAIDRSFQGNLQDKHLREVSSRLRIGCDTNADWLQPFLAVRTGAVEFDALNRHITDQCKKLLEDEPPSWGSKLKARPLLHAIIEVAQRHHHVESATEIPLLPAWCTQGLYSPPQTAIATASLAGNLFADEDIKGEARRIQSEDGSSDIAEIDVDGRLSWTHQRLHAHSVLLLSSEEIQFLPWSWNHPNPLETKHLSNWVSTHLEHHQFCERILGALVWISLRTGRSLRRALDIGIGSNVLADWSWDRRYHALRRIPPMRKPGWQPKSTEEADWVTQMAEAIAIPIHPSVEAILDRGFAHCPEAQSLGDLWDTNWECSPEQKFRETTHQGPLGRITPGILAGALPQRIFEDSGDAVLARLVSSHPLSGLPGSCAYASWPEAQLASIWPPANPVSLIPVRNKRDEEINGLGSRLDPIEALLNNSIRLATSKLRKLRREGSVIVFHNALTSYLAVALLAATGSRPVKDIFESPLHFDLIEGFVYIDDKASSELRQGRLVPLPRSLCRYLGHRYPAHLTRLANAVRPAHPKLADEILALTLGKPTGALPYLFLLNDDPTLTWGSLSESTLESSELFDWPLPYNLFRHRLAQNLRQRGVNPEIIDSLLGHAETGCATHADYSCRVWTDDMSVARNALESAFRALHFVPVSGARTEYCPLPPAQPGTAKGLLPRPFGTEARRQAREEHERLALEDARLLIEEFLAGRQLGDLDGDQIHELSKRLLFNPNGMPSSIGGLRYRYLNEQLEAIWQAQGRRPRLKKRFLHIEAEASPFTEAAPGALGIYRHLCTLFDQVLDGTPPSRTNIREASAIAATAFSLENRISSPALLNDILNGRHFRLVTLKQKVYFEYVPQVGGRTNIDANRRHCVTYRTAAFLDRALSGKPKSTGTLPSTLEPLASFLQSSGRLAIAPLDTSAFLVCLSSLVDQVNAMTLPGILAAYLAGRVQSFPLTWRDWIRMECGVQVLIPAQPEDTDEPTTFEAHAGDEPLPGGIALPPTNKELDALQIAARECFSALRKHLNTYQGDLSSKLALSRRRDLVRDLEKELRQWSGKVSSAVLALGQWMTSLVMRGKNRRTLNALNTTERYFTALAPAFEEIAYNVDLMALDEEDITLFYGDLLESRRSVQDYGYVCNRLVDFHRWACTHGADDPDWSELPMEAAGHQVSPGFITEAEYQNALLLLTRTTSSDREKHWLAAFLLLCCFRFGLRSSEALGLLRVDWIELDGTTVVLIRNNRIRQLKTPASRRQVPLLFSLSSLEQSIILHVQMRAEAQHGDKLAAPLFAAYDESLVISAPGPLKKIVIASLKTVTGNPEIILHHARHTAANRVAIGLICPPLDDIWVNNTAGGDIRIDLSLLGRPGVSRRTTWGCARFLGHAGPSTSLRSYLHFLGDWCDALLVTGQVQGRRYSLAHAIDLESFATKAPVNTDLLEQLETPFVVPSPGRLLRFIRLLGRGKGALDASAALDLDPELAKRLEAALHIIGRKFALAPSQADPRTDDSAPLGFLRRIKESAWTRLLTLDVLKEHHSEPPAPRSLSLDAFVKMIGSSRHLILWKPEHLDFARDCLHALKIDSSRYRCIHSAHADTQHLQLAQHYGFKPISPLEAKRGNSPQHPDRTYEGENQEFEVRKRCALIFEENNDFPIRNSIEFVLVMLALVGQGD